MLYNQTCRLSRPNCQRFADPQCKGTAVWMQIMTLRNALRPSYCRNAITWARHIAAYIEKLGSRSVRTSRRNISCDVILHLIWGLPDKWWSWFWNIHVFLFYKQTVCIVHITSLLTSESHKHGSIVSLQCFIFFMNISNRLNTGKKVLFIHLLWLYSNQSFVLFLV